MSKQPEANLPKWVRQRYDSLWTKFQNKSFDLDDAFAILKKDHQDKRENVPVVLSEIRKAGWLTAELDPKDSRKRIYKLTSHEKIVGLLRDIEKETLGRDEIEKILKRAADLIRTRVDYKFILVLLFLKRVNDKWESEFDDAYEEAIEDGLSEKDAKKEASSSAYHDFDLPKESRWENLRKEVEVLPEIFSKAMKALSERNPDLRDIFDNVDFLQFASNRENAEILKQLVELFSEKRLHNVSPDVLGDAYEWILRYFSPEKAKEGEVYTPREVVKLLVELADPKPKEKIYDPASASGGMLIMSYRHVKDQKGKEESDKLFLFGQEANPHTLALGRMNMYIHDITNAQLAPGDTLLRPKFKDGENIRKFDVVLANPPWNQDGYGDEVLKKGEFWHKRFPYGFTPPQSADWAWIQHMLASSNEETGRVGIVLDTGSLFRSGKEVSIRSAIIERDLLECVVLLPEKLFYNTFSPAAVLIFNQNKDDNRKDQVLFINAADEWESHPDIRKLNILTDKNIEKIVKSYNQFKNCKGFSKIVTKKELAKGNYNLNVIRYVSTSEEDGEIDVDEAIDQLQLLDSEDESSDKKLKQLMSKGITTKEFQDTEIGKIPASWDLVNLIDLVDDKKDIVAGPFGSNLKVKDYTKTGVPLIRLQNIERNHFINENIKYISPEKAKELKSHSFKSGDIVLAKLGIPIGKTCVVPKILKEGIVVADVVRIRVSSKKANNTFVEYVLNSNYCAEQLRKETIGTTRPRVNISQIRNLKIPLPPLPEQEKIAEILTITDSKLSLQEKRGYYLNLVKKGLMNDLLTGKKRLN